MIPIVMNNTQLSQAVASKGIATSIPPAIELQIAMGAMAHIYRSSMTNDVERPLYIYTLWLFNIAVENHHF